MLKLSCPFGTENKKIWKYFARFYIRCLEVIIVANWLALINSFE